MEEGNDMHKPITNKSDTITSDLHYTYSYTPVEVFKEKEPTYKVQVFVAHGFYEYEVSDLAQAMAHGQAIMATGVYRSGSTDDQVEFHKCYKVKVKGPGLRSKYIDKFVRT